MDTINSIFTIEESITIQKIPTKPYPGQKPGTSGLRKKVKTYSKNNLF